MNKNIFHIINFCFFLKIAFQNSLIGRWGVRDNRMVFSACFDIPTYVPCSFRITTQTGTVSIIYSLNATVSSNIRLR
jgi:hypothetical protein